MVLCGSRLGKDVDHYVREVSTTREQDQKKKVSLVLVSPLPASGQHILVFPQRLALGHFKEALGVNLVEEGEKEHPELEKLRSPW